MSVTGSTGVMAVNRLLAAKKSEIGSPNAMFQEILAEKMGTFGESGVETTAVQTATSANSSGVSDYSDLLYYLGSGDVSGVNLLGNSYASQIAAQAAALGGSASSTQYDGYIKAAANQYGVPESLIKAVIACESSFNPNAVSKSGAVGLMQLMPATAKGLGVTNAYDPQQNIMGGTKYLSSLLDNFDGDHILALAGYNMGGTRVKNLGITPNSSNQSAYSSIPSGVMSYATKVIKKMAEYGG